MLDRRAERDFARSLSSLDYTRRSHERRALTRRTADATADAASVPVLITPIVGPPRRRAHRSPLASAIAWKQTMGLEDPTYALRYKV